MRVKDLIEDLSELDPTAQVIIDGCPVSRITLQEGYEDGYYAYIDDELNYCITTKLNKCIIEYTEMHDYIWAGKASKILIEDSLSEAAAERIRKLIEIEEASYKEFVETCPEVKQ